jgi:ABC-2 type transport system ATP-binding protein
VLAEGTPEQLGGRDDAPTTIRFRLPRELSPTDLPVVATADHDGFTIETATPTATLAALTGWAAAQGHELVSIEVNQPSLEDVYLQLTADDEADDQAAHEAAHDGDGGGEPT